MCAKSKNNHFMTEKPKKTVKSNWQIRFFGLSYIVGFLIGVSVLFWASQQAQLQLDRILECYLVSRNQWSTGRIFFAALFSVCWPLILLFGLGYFPAGRYLVALICWLQGLGCGFAAVGIYRQTGAVVPVHTLMVLVSTLFLQALTLLSAAEAVWKVQQNPHPHGYPKRYLLPAALAVATAVLDVFLSSR